MNITEHWFNYYLLFLISGKFAEKFAKKSNFSYVDLYNGLTRKEQKLSLDRACRKFLKKRQECKQDDTGNGNEISKKRKVEYSSSDDEDPSSPSAKKKVRKYFHYINTQTFITQYCYSYVYRIFGNIISENK